MNKIEFGDRCSMRTFRSLDRNEKEMFYTYMEKTLACTKRLMDRKQIYEAEGAKYEMFGKRYFYVEWYIQMLPGPPILTSLDTFQEITIDQYLDGLNEEKR